MQGRFNTRVAIASLSAELRVDGMKIGAGRMSALPKARREIARDG
jgi:hypothetical protein